jgi:hypothetical protein
VNVINFNEKLKEKTQRKLKNQIFSLAHVINDYSPQPFNLTILSDDLIELQKTYSVVEKIYNSLIYDHIKNDFERDLIQLNINLKRNKTNFLFPTIQSDYRKSIYPIKPLYFELEKCLLNPKRKNKKQKWVWSLFKDKIWLDHLIDAIDVDIKYLFVFIKKYYKHNYESIDKELIELNKLRQDLKQYKHVFQSLKEKF